MLKQCGHCSQLLEVTEFSSNKGTKDGLSSWCKICRSRKRTSKEEVEKEREIKRKYRKTAKGKELVEKWNNSEAGKAAQKRHQESGAKAEYAKKYDQTPEGIAARQRYKEKNRQKVLARAAVNNAVIRGELPHVSTLKCDCGKLAEEYHHHMGYDDAHKLDVVPKCVECHRVED